MRKKNLIVAMTVLTTVLNHLDAQTIWLDYITELQTDFKNANWVNLLQTSFEIPMYKSLAFEGSTISVAKTRDTLIDDLQTFSNIEDENLTLALAVFGLGWEKNNTALFFGVRNVNEDYFTSPITSLFTNSSCGIFPTISANYDIANYPLASICIDVRQRWRDWTLQASIYNGQGYNGFKKEDHPFLFRPAKDGVFSMAAINYDHAESHYELGCAVHLLDSKAGSAPWLNVEQRLGSRLHLLAQGSANFAAVSECKHYEALGVVAKFGKINSGLVFNHAAFAEVHEYATEATCIIPIIPSFTLQPTLHLIKTGNETNCVALLRLSYTL